MTSDSGIPKGDRGSASDLRGWVRLELDKLRDLVQKVSLDEIRQGEWFARLLKFSLDQYVTEVDAAYFARVYPGLSPDELVRARIEMAARNASVGGALTSGAYAGAFAATVGSRGAASPVMLPAAGASFALDLLHMANLQLRLAYDIAVITGVPLDLDDPEDLWKLIRVAFVSRIGPTGGRPWAGGRPSRCDRSCRRSSPVTPTRPPRACRPWVGSCSSATWSSSPFRAWGAADHRRQLLVGRRVREPSRRRLPPGGADHGHRPSDHRAVGRPAELLWVLWLIIKADGVVHENERLLLKHVSALVGDLDSELSALAGLDRTIDFDLRSTVSIPDFVSQDTEALYQAGVAAAAVDGSIDPNELSRLKKVANHCSVPFDPNAARKQAADEARAV